MSYTMVRQLVLAVGCIACTPTMAIEVAALWDFSNPSFSESRFRSALETATGDDALILQTQIARTYQLRRDFGKARALLQSIEKHLENAGAEVRARYWLEFGRTYVSHRHPQNTQTPEAKQIARDAFTKALSTAKDAQLDGLAIDAIHMFAFVDTSPSDQLARGLEALALIEASDKPEAKQWEASVRSNLGEALYDIGRYDEALLQFRRSLTLRENKGDPSGIRDAQWHVARVLRVQKRTDEALVMQLRLERESRAAGNPKHYIFEELALLYQSMGDKELAKYYAIRAKALAK